MMLRRRLLLVSASKVQRAGKVARTVIDHWRSIALSCFGRWREANPEDKLRFHALRLREGGMLKSMPQQHIARSTDWRFLNELKLELKA